MGPDGSRKRDNLALERDELWFDRHPALAFCLSMIFFGKPDSTPDQVRGKLFRIML
jgi:hypothetical protein